MRQLKIHAGHVRAVGYSPDGKWLVSAGNDRTVRLIEVTTGKVCRKWGPFGHVMSSATFSPSGTLLVAAGGLTCLELMALEGDFATKVILPTTIEYRHLGYLNISALGYSPDGKRFFAGTGVKQTSREDGDLHLWRCSTEREWTWDHRETIPGFVWSGAFSPDGATLALGTGLGWRFCTVSPWHMGGASTQGPGTKSLAWSPDGRTLAVASGHSILLVNAVTKEIRATLTGHEAPIMALTFTPDGQRLLSGGWDQNVRVWDPHLAVPIATYDWQRGKVHSIAVAPDGMTAVAACDKGIVLWDLDD